MLELFHTSQIYPVRKVISFRVFLFRPVLFILLICIFFSCNDPYAPITKEERIEGMIKNIRNTPEWITQLNKEAKEKGVALDSLVKKAAVFMIEQEDNRKKSRFQRIEEIKQEIQKTPEWIGSLRKEAEEKKLPLDSLINAAAGFMVDQQDGKK